MLKNDKKLNVYNVPKERSITKTKQNINVIQKTVSITEGPEEKEINNSGKSFTVVISKKITEIKNGEDDNREEVIEKQIFVNNNLIETEEIIEGKNALKKYIEQK